MIPLTNNATILSQAANGRRVLDIRGKWVNWLDDQTWKPIDCSFVEVGQRWECRTGPLTVTVPKRSTDVAEIVSTNRWDCFSKARINDPAFLVNVQAQDVSLVDAVLESPTTIAFPGAYPFGDLLYRMNFGRAVRCEKLVRINSQPQGNGDLRLSFAISGDPSDWATHDRTLDDMLADEVQQIGRDVTDKLNQDKPVGEIMAEVFRQRAYYRDAVIAGPKTTRGTFGARPSQTDSHRGIGFKAGKAWDSSPEPQAIGIEIQILRNPLTGGVTLTKVIPREFLESATYPVFTDTTSTFYPDPNVEVTSVDGRVLRSGVNETYSTIRSGAGTSFSDSLTVMQAGRITSSSTTDQYSDLYRGIALFDTSAIGTGNSVTGTTEMIYGTGKTDGGLTGTKDINVYSSSPASNTSLSNGDFIQIDATALCDSPIAYAGYSTTDYNSFVFNATGLASVSVTGITKTGFRLANLDADNVSPGWSSLKVLQFVCASADDTSGTKDPKLVVDYSPAATGNRRRRVLMGTF